MRTTTRYAIPVPEDNDPADVATTVGATADSVDAALYGAVQEAKAAATTGLQAGLVNAFLFMGS